MCNKNLKKRNHRRIFTLESTPMKYYFALFLADFLIVFLAGVTCVGSLG